MTARWLALALVVLLVGSCATEVPQPPRRPVTRYTLPMQVPGHWEFCVEAPQLHFEVPDEPMVPGPTVCRGTVAQLRHEFSHLRRAQ